VNAITILFQDKIALSFDLEPRRTVFPELSDWKTGNWRGNVWERDGWRISPD
jgi:hypothetical protein